MSDISDTAGKTLEEIKKRRYNKKLRSKTSSLNHTNSHTAGNNAKISCNNSRILNTSKTNDTYSDISHDDHVLMRNSSLIFEKDSDSEGLISHSSSLNNYSPGQQSASSLMQGLPSASNSHNVTGHNISFGGISNISHASDQSAGQISGVKGRNMTTPRCELIGEHSTSNENSPNSMNASFHLISPTSSTSMSAVSAMMHASHALTGMSMTPAEHWVGGGWNGKSQKNLSGIPGFQNLQPTFTLETFK